MPLYTRLLLLCLALCCLPLSYGLAAEKAPAGQKAAASRPQSADGATQNAASGKDTKQNAPANGGTIPDFTSTLTEKAESAHRTTEETLAMLNTLLQQGKTLRQDLAQVEQSLKGKADSADNASLDAQLKGLNQQLGETNRDFERIATGVELSIFQPAQAQRFDWKEELTSLLDPMVKEMRTLTAAAKQRSDTKDRIVVLQKQADAAAQAVGNLEKLLKTSQDKILDKQLSGLLASWKNEETRIKGRLELARMELQALSKQNGSLLEQTGQRLSVFFKTRGLYLLLAVLAFSCTLLLLRYLARLLLRHLPRDAQGRHPMYARLITVFSHFISLIFASIALVAVFYVAADWFMLSLVILLFVGVLWAVRQTLPRQWEQSLIMLNMGAVREGERLVIDGVPWRVDSLGMFCRLSNQDLDQVLRVPIASMLERTSRPYDLDEPWFPCKKGDYIKLGGDIVAQVINLSHEQVQVQHSGLLTVYPTAAFLGMAVANMSQKFNVSTTLGLSYDLQAEITESIPKILRSYLQKRLDEEGYSSKCLGVTCEFGLANSSTLDISVILEFQGDMANLYYRLRRALQRWCVDCCTENKWDIPFNQITVHTA